MNRFRLFTMTFFSLICITDGYSQIYQDQDLYSDSSSIRIVGLIVNEEDGEKVPYVHILNKTSKKGTTSDLSGEFSITIKQKDTLVFSAVGFEDYFFTFSESAITSNHYSLKISLNHSTLELSPVSIFAFQNESAFKNEILNLEIKDTNKEIIIPGAFYGTPEPAKTKVYLNGGLGCSGCITSLLNLFQKQAKEDKELAKQKSLIPKNREIFKKYNPEIVKQITGLSGENLNKFLLFCEIEDEFILQSSEYEIFVAVNDCYKSFPDSKD